MNCVPTDYIVAGLAVALFAIFVHFAVEIWSDVRDK